MLNKRKARELAMQIMFLWDSSASQDVDSARQIVTDGSEDQDIRKWALEWATAAWEQREISDKRIEQISPQWPPKRQPTVDRNIVRLAMWELCSTPTPPKVVLDEAIEIAKHFSTDQSAGFINGVLDAALKENVALTNGVPATASDEKPAESKTD